MKTSGENHLRAFAGAVLAVLAGSVLGAPRALAHGGGGSSGGGHVVVHGGGHGRAAGGRHGGAYSRYQYVTFYVGGVYPYLPLNLGPNIILFGTPMELTDAPVLATEGELHREDVIAQHTLRVLEARVLDAPATVKSEALAAGTVLVKVQSLDAKQTLWCSLKPNGRIPMTVVSRYTCLADAKATGRFDQSWTGGSETHFLGLVPSGAADPQPLAQPVAYHEARLEERPTARVGYRWCDGDGVNGPTRFAVAVTLTEGAESWHVGDREESCALGVWPRAGDHGRVDVGGLIIDITQAPKSETLHYKVEGRLPPIPRIEGLVAGEDVRAEEPADVKAMLVEAAQLELKKEALLVSGEPKADGGTLSKGAVFFTVPVVHGLTGRLMNEVRGKGWMADRALPVGQAVYGVPMAGATDVDIIWCAPRQEPNPEHPGVIHWSGVCLPDGYWVPARVAMMTTDIVWPAGGGRLSSPPTVQRGPVDFPPMSLTYAYGGLNKDGYLLVDINLDWGEGPQRLRQILAPFNAAGEATLNVMGGVAVVHRAPAAAATGPMPEAQVVLEVRSPPKPGGRIAY